MRIHYLQHVPFENPGIILDWAKENGYSVTSTQLFNAVDLPGQDTFDWLVVMGGPMNIYEDVKYPWLVKEKAFIREAVQNGKIVIGLCLGAQLIADVIGGKVTRNPVTEIGWFPVRLTASARKSSLFSFFPEAPVVFEWHGDTFCELPTEAQLIAENDACQHQAFIYRKKVFAFQYHLENTLKIITGLVENCRDEMIPGQYVQSPEEVLTHPEYIEQDNQWMREFLSRLDTAWRNGIL